MEKARSPEIRKEIARKTGAYLCFDCGKCTSSCPVGKAGAVYSPRALVQHLMLNRTDPLEVDMWRCLTCGLCKERCPSNVDYPQFIRLLRATATACGIEPQPTHGSTIGRLTRIMAKPRITQQRVDWLPDWVTVIDEDTGTQAEAIYFVGCAPYFDVIFGDFKLDLLGTHMAGLELLKLRGITPAVLANERCCGHDALWSGDTDLFRSLAEANVDLFRRAGAKRIYVTCPEGYHTMSREYPEHLGDLEFEFINTTQFIANATEETVAADGETIVTLHDPCRMGRFSGIYDEPRRLIDLMEGITLKEMYFARENAPCCGSNLWINCDQVSKRMQMNLLAEAEATGAAMLLTSCDKCRIHLACAQLEMGSVTSRIATDNILRFLYRKGVRKA